MVVDKPSTALFQVGWEEGPQKIVKVKKELDEGAPDGSLGLGERVPNVCGGSNEGLKMSIKAEGKRLAEVRLGTQLNHDFYQNLSKPFKYHFNCNQSGGRVGWLY